jgi:signal transduction histidine kinase
VSACAASLRHRFTGDSPTNRDPFHRNGRLEEMTVRRDIEKLARACVAARDELRRASRVLHDEVGSSLAVAGLRLQLLSTAAPASAKETAELTSLLEQVMESVRRLSRELDPSPAGRAGLKSALLSLVDRHQHSFKEGITVDYAVRAALQPSAADALFLAIQQAVDAAAVRRVKRIAITASGTKIVTVRIAHPGRAPDARKDLQIACMLARAAGLGIDVRSEKGTIVLIRYALRRSPRG